MKRKSFIDTSMRIMILGGFALLVGIFALEGKITRSNECSESFQCKGCKKRNNCRIPESEKIIQNG